MKTLIPLACAWVLWETASVNTDKSWRYVFAHETFAECNDQRAALAPLLLEQMRLVAQQVNARAVRTPFLAVECVPATIDPRGPKQ